MKDAANSLTFSLPVRNTIDTRPNHIASAPHSTHNATVNIVHTEKKTCETTWTNDRDDIIFARGAARPTIRTAQFCNFLHKTVPLFKACNCNQRQMLVRSLATGHRHGRFLKKENAHIHHHLCRIDVEKHILLAFRAMNAKAKPTARTKTNLPTTPPSAPDGIDDSENLSSLIHTQTCLPSQHNTQCHESSRKISMDKKTRRIFRRVISEMTPPELQVFGIDLANLEKKLDDCELSSIGDVSPLPSSFFV